MQIFAQVFKFKDFYKIKRGAPGWWVGFRVRTHKNWYSQKFVQTTFVKILGIGNKL